MVKLLRSEALRAKRADEAILANFKARQWNSDCVRDTLELIRNNPTLLGSQPFLEYKGKKVKKKNLFDKNLLHLALKFDAPTEIVRELIHKYPRFAKILAKRIHTPLHMGLVSGARPDSIQAVLAAYPRAVDIIDWNGRTPLHVGMYHRAPVAIIAALLDASPESAASVDSFSKTPLHSGLTPLCAIHAGTTYGVENLWSPETISMVMKARPNAIMQSDIQGRTPLHLAMQPEVPVDTVVSMAQLCPIALRVADETGRTPIFLGVDYGIGADELCAIVTRFPVVLEDRLGNGRTLLHHMMGKSMYDSAVATVVQAFEQLETNSSISKDKDGHSPLHLAMLSDASNKAISSLIEHSPYLTKNLDKQGRSPLFLGIQNGTSIHTIRVLLNAFPGAAELTDVEHRTALHVCTSRIDAPEIVLDLVKVYPGAIEMLDSDGMTPLHRFIENQELPAIASLLKTCPDAAKAKDKNGKSPLHVMTLNAVDLSLPDESIQVSIIRSIFEFCPTAGKVRDGEGNTPMLSFTMELNGRATDRSFQNATGTRIFKALCDSYPLAAEMENEHGVSPISLLVNWQFRSSLMIGLPRQLIKFMLKGLRDGRPLRRLCSLERPLLLGKYLALFSDTSKNSLTINLDQKIIPGWTFLEILADLDNDDASNILLQIVKQQSDGRQMDNPTVKISCHDAEKTVVLFRTCGMATEETMAIVADRAKLSLSSDMVRNWGLSYGRFLEKYRMRNELPKHVSETCVVAFATEARIDEDGRRADAPVALKFLKSSDAFCREIEKRNTINSLSESSHVHQYVVPMLAAYASASYVSELGEQERQMFAQVGVVYATNLDEGLHKFKNLLLSGENEYRYLLVMECGAGLDLHDVISHHNIAGRNLPAVLSICTGIAESLAFLNENCRIVHGDVKARNFISMGVGAGYAAVDLDNASSIELGEAVGKKRTSSGYLPPEQATVEASIRASLRTNGTNHHIAAAIVDAELTGLEHELNKAFEEGSYNEHLRLLQALGDAKRKMEQIQGTGLLAKPVKSSAQYDMWQFGVLCFYLFTGEQLFSADTKEDVNDTELVKIVSWDREALLSKLALIPRGWPRGLIADLLQPAPENRPDSWKIVIDQLRRIEAGDDHFRVQHKKSPSMWSISYWQLMEFDEWASNEFGADYPKMTMRDINDKVFVPSCRKEGRSYALTCNPGGLMLDAFISHSWDEEFHAFVKSLRKVFQTTVSKPNLWICAFALNQCDPQIIEAQVGNQDNPLSESPFVMALEHALTFVVVRNTVTDLYSRIWCVCELIYAKKMGLVPNKTHVTGPDVFSHLETSCLDATCTVPTDKDRILDVLLKEHDAEEIDRFVQLFRNQQAPE